MNMETNKGLEKIFGFDIVNVSHDEIHISAFNELALSLYNQLHIGIVYIVSNGTVKASNPIFNHLKSHNEIFLGSQLLPTLICKLHFFVTTEICFNINKSYIIIEISYRVETRPSIKPKFINSNGKSWRCLP